MRKSISRLAAAAALAAALAPAFAWAAADIPYYKLNYAKYDYTYQWEVERAKRYASFYWDGTLYCRYRSGWQGPGAYHVGTRWKTRFGWDGGYPWQGPGAPADRDEDDERSPAQIRADYNRDFRRAGECGPRRHHRRVHHQVVLRRKD